jgi:hypothetical protein
VSICRYQSLPNDNRHRLDRALYWLVTSSRQWGISTSASFTCLVTALESLISRGTKHRAFCDTCRAECTHESPGAMERFRTFLEKYAPGASETRRRNEMYNLRSDISHGSGLMNVDLGLTFGWDPPWWNERELHEELWSITRLAMRNWLTAHSAQ